VQRGRACGLDATHDASVATRAQHVVDRLGRDSADWRCGADRPTRAGARRAPRALRREAR
jgi:hypothetical protein